MKVKKYTKLFFVKLLGLLSLVLFLNLASYGQGATCATATNIGLNTVTGIVTANGAPDVPVLTGCTTNAVIKEGWFKFTASTAFSAVVFDNSGSQNAFIYIYSGACGSLSDVACKNILMSKIDILNFPTASGQTYYIRLVQADIGGTVSGRVGVYSNKGNSAAVCATDKIAFSTGTAKANGSKTDNLMQCGYSGSYCVGYAKFNTTAIPTASFTIDKIILELTCSYNGLQSTWFGDEYVYLVKLKSDASDPVTASGASMYQRWTYPSMDITGFNIGPYDISSNTTFHYDLNSTALTNFTARYAQGFWGISCPVDWASGYNNGDYMQWYGWNSNYIPFIVVTYTSSGCTVPTISGQPAAPTTTPCEGTDINFNITADGTAPLTYQWRKDGTAIPTGTNSSLALNKITAADAGSYTCIVSNACPGSVTSNAAVLAVNIKPLVTYTTPDKKKCDLRDTAVFKAIGNGGPFTYQWYHDANIITGETISSYTISGGLSSGDAGGYYCVLTNGCGSATTNTSSMLIGTTPVIQKQIPDQTACLGSGITFTVDATNVTTYQWTLFGTDIPDATNSTYDIISSKATDEGIYSCKVGNNCTTISINSFMFTPGKKPAIGIEPVSNSKAIGDSLIYILTPEGTKPFTYQWQKDAANIDGATKDTLEIKPIKVEDAGAYTCIITNACGSTTVNLGTLTILRDNFLEGTLTYDNAENTPLKNVQLTLTNAEGLPSVTIYTDLTGYFKFEKIKNGNYTITATTSKLWGGGDPLDALICNRYYIDAASFGDNLKRDAADVNGDGYIDPLDALFISRRYLDFINSFDAGDWIFENVNVQIQDADVIYDFKGICFGDVDGSFVPTDK